MDSTETSKLLELSEKRRFIESESHKSNSKRQKKEELFSSVQNLVSRLDKRADTAEKAFLETRQRLRESRFSKDFVLGNLLGEGAYGDVWKCMHRIDKCSYAVKRVRFIGSSEILLSEVCAMSKLRHEGIVRYHTSWIEVDDITPDMNVEVVEFREVEKEKEIDVEKEMYDDSDDNEDDDDDEYEYDDDEEVEKKEAIRYFDLCETGNLQSLHYSLFIQMELCDKTLYDAMFSGPTPLDDQTGREYFKQIVMAVLYMHQQGVVHKDLASVNIFLNKVSKIKIGDFGIAKIGSPDLHASSPGQTFYREPNRAPGEKIDSKTDIYSLGILFLELISRVKSGQERQELIVDLRKNERLPKEMNARDKTFISLLTSKVASDRPSVEDIVKMSPWNATG